MNQRAKQTPRSAVRSSGALSRIVRALGYVRRFLLNPRIRSEQITRLLHGTQQFQAATATEPARYPELFQACSRFLASIAEPRVLSFGCSTGEEPASLAAFMPNAKIFGADINRWCLRQCRRINRNPRIEFMHVADRGFEELGDLDAIFCMAVFQRTENRLKTADFAQDGFTFQQFDHEIGCLDQKLKTGGLFFIDHADFRFQDTSVAARYARMEFPGNEREHQRPLFGRDNRLIAQHYTQPRGFVKLR